MFEKTLFRRQPGDPPDYPPQWLSMTESCSECGYNVGVTNDYQYCPRCTSPAREDISPRPGAVGAILQRPGCQARLVMGYRWLVWDDGARAWVVYSHRPRQKRARTLIETEDLGAALRILEGND